MEPRRIEPGPGQESVWDYPRPPALERTDAHLRVEVGGVAVAETHRGWRTMETSQPPAFYFPPDDVRVELLVPTTTLTFCEWKGQAAYASIRVDDRLVPDAAWKYDHPTARFEAITGHWSFYAQRVDRCTVDGEVVVPMEGSFYGGWITSKVVGPFKGGPGTAGW
jgi:uncharacterized protein (DUF427 family)